MSDEGRFHVKVHSPFTGWNFWLHYILGDIANVQHDWEIWMRDSRIATEWRVSSKSVARARGMLTEQGHLTVLSGKASRGHPLRYRFEFLCPDGAVPCNAGRSRKGGLAGGLSTVAKADSESEKGGLRGDAHISLTEREQKPTDDVEKDPIKVAAHRLAVVAFEQPVKPDIARAGADGPFPAVLALLERRLRSGVTVETLESAVQHGVRVWTLAGLQMAEVRAEQQMPTQSNRVAEAVDTIRRQIGSVGYTGAPEFEDALAKQIVDQIGWGRLCRMTEFDLSREATSTGLTLSRTSPP